MNANDKKLNELLERWQNGDFTRADEQELQRLLAGGDQFSREAAEGFAAFPEENHAQRLENLRKKIAPASKRNVFWTGRLMAVAATLVLLIAAVYWISLPGSQEKQIAQAPQPSLTPSAPEIADADGTNELPQTSIPAEKGKATPGNTAPSPEAASKPSAVLSAPVTSADKNNFDDEVATAGESVPVSDSISAAPLSNASVKEREDSRATPQNAILQPPVAAPNSAPKAEEYDQKTMNADRAKSSRGAAVRESKSDFNAKKKALAGPSPAGGWDKFRIDMRNKMNLPQNARDNGVNTATVTLSVDINPLTGKVRSVLFLNHAGYGCDEIAEQFVQGYNWVVMPGGATEVEVEVIFR